MASPLEVQLILCDAAQADPTSGKVHMLGAGWSITRAPFQHAVVALVKVPWDRTNRPHDLTLDLTDSDGNQRVALPDGEKVSLHAEGKVEVGRPAGLAAGSLLDASFALNVPLLNLPPGRYEWRLKVAEFERVASFTVRA